MEQGAAGLKSNLDYEFAQGVMGDDIFPYGIERNLPTLGAATLYSVEQGLTERRLELSEIVTPETWEL